MLIPIDEAVHFDVTTHLPGTGAVSDADSAPTFDVFEEATDTPILDDQTMTKRTSLTGNYRGTFTASAANGFEAGKWYAVVVSATVDSIAAKHVAMHFRVAPAEASAGVPKVDLSHWLGTAAATPTVAGVPEVDVTHFGGTGGAFDAGRPAVESVNDPVTVGTNNDKTGYGLADGAITAAKIATDAIDADALAADAIAEINATVDQALADYDGPTHAELVSEINAVQADIAALENLSQAEAQAAAEAALVANHLDHLFAVGYDPQNKPGDAGSLLNEMVESDNASPERARFTAGALEQAPSGGGGVADWTADERTAIRSILGIPGSGTTPADPTTGILDTIRDKIDVVDGIVDDILVDTAEIGAAGAGLTEAGGTGDHLTAINLPNQTMDIVGNITGNLSGSVGSVTAGVTLADDAITAAKYDESTAFPLKSNDAGATQVARVGADGDTLETLSDQIDAKASQTSVDDLPTNSELATALAAADDAVLAAIAALNNLSAADVRSAVGLASANLDTQLDALPTAAENAAALMDLANGIETSITPRQALRLILAASAGKLSGAATTTITIRNVGDSKDRITATVDSDGNRTAVTTDAT